MKILIACEESQTVCKEFRKLGHEAYSCDILPCSGGYTEWHIKEDVSLVVGGWIRVVYVDECVTEDWDVGRECVICPICKIQYSERYHPGPDMEYEHKEFSGVLYAKCFDWDMIIAFPPCTHLAVSGARHFEQKIKDGRQQEGVDFFMMFVDAKCEKIAIENPVGIMSSKYRKPDQIIQPFEFGDSFKKTTCLWLKRLPKLIPTSVVDEGEMFEFISKKGEKKKQPKWYFDALKLSPSERAKARSKTFPGIAQAMAAQWGNL